MAAVPCPRCKAAMDAAPLLAGLSYWRGPGIFTGTCPHCGEGLELRVSASRIELGYTYWAGSMHFEGMIDRAVAGLRRVDADGAIALVLDGVSYPIPAGD